MIYKLIVNAAFLVVGYYIGKEVGRSEPADNKPKHSATSSSLGAKNEASLDTSEKPKI
jgi:hypothetical protein